MLGEVERIRMEEIQQILGEVKELSEKTARIETHIEYQKYQYDEIKKSLLALESTKSIVHKHDLQIKGFAWFFGLLVSFFTAKVFGKF